MEDLTALVIPTALSVAAMAILMTDFLTRLLLHRHQTAPEASEAALSFLFEGRHLVDTTPSGRVFLKRCAATSLDDVIRALRPQFPELGAALGRVERDGQLQLLAQDGSANLRLAVAGECLRLELTPTAGRSDQLVMDAREIEGLQNELDQLRGVADASPHLMWLEDADGQIAWVNRAYLEFCGDNMGTTDLWPLPRIFDTEHDGDEIEYSRRLWVGSSGANGKPFQVNAIPHQAGRFFTAVQANEQVNVENARQDLLQTLGKTFAQISIGLAIFSADRRLILFNPALVDITGLDPAHLSAQPRMQDVLDCLRELRVVPEPKDYKAWRERLVGTEGLSENWSLPDGRTLHVTALPQPEGTVALIFEDITGQVLQHRSFRSTLETYQLLLDRRDNALAVFGPDGALTLRNDAYGQFWELPQDETAGDQFLAQSLALWTSSAQPCPDWQAFPTGGLDCGNRFEMRFMMADGRAVALEATGLPGGCLLVEFTLAADHLSAANRRRLKLMA